MTQRYVIYHPEMGVYLGHCLGLAFFSKLDAAGQDCAVTSETEAAAWMVVAELRRSGTLNTHNFTIVPVTPDRDEFFATIVACVAAGLPAWSP